MIDPTYTLVQVTDTHILPRAEDRLHGVDTLANLRAAVDLVEARNIQPDAFLFTGDLADKGDPASYARLRAVFEDVERRFGVPALAAVGNHDNRPALREELLGEPASEAPLYYRRWLGDLRIVVLDSSVPGAAQGALDAEQLAWLRAELETLAPEGTVLVVHHPRCRAWCPSSTT
jgi:3',5'-cyclic AMP phosphodiesterase CpdA